LDATSQALGRYSGEDGSKVLLVSDYGRGLFTELLSEGIGEILDEATPDLILLDPRPVSGDTAKFNLPGAILTPNRGEAETLADQQVVAGDIDSAHDVGATIMSTYPNIEGVMLTLDCDGVLYMDRRGLTQHSPATVNGQEAMNPSGAGDIVASMVAVTSSTDFDQRTILDTAMWLAGASVTESYTTSLSPELINKTRSCAAYLLDKS
jgi:bifunctional ADP-heptose synthase (sugar kinase/adenylyltransferase)